MILGRVQKIGGEGHYKTRGKCCDHISGCRHIHENFSTINISLTKLKKLTLDRAKDGKFAKKCK